MRRSALRHITLALLLLFAQTVSAAHGLSHSADTASHSDKQLPHSPACELCAAAATLGGALPAAPLAFEPTGTDTIVVRHVPASFRSGPVTAYSSRAPPRFA